MSETDQMVDAEFCFTRIHILSVNILIVWIDKVYMDPFKIALKYLKNNLRRPFENCELTPLFYKITKTLYRKLKIE